MTLFDSDQTTFLADDDDSGDGTNASITYTLNANQTYYLKVAGYNNTETGNYQVAVTITPFYVQNSSNTAWIIGIQANPTLNLIRGLTYTFTISAPGHPFWINTIEGTGTGNAYSTGVTNNGTDDGTITFVVDAGAPSTLYYNCQFDSMMNGVINITS